MEKNQNSKLGMTLRGTYKIEVLGVVDDHSAQWFTAYALNIQPSINRRSTSALTCKIRDQAELRELLDRLFSLNLPLLQVSLIGDDEMSASVDTKYKYSSDEVYKYTKDRFSISTDPDLLDIEMIHAFVSRSYWARGIPKELVAKAVRHSFCFGLYEHKNQIGFARLITDFTTEAEICEVFVLEPYQGRGLGTWLMTCIISCPALQGIRTLSLGTADAHNFYEKVGFHIVGRCPNRMQIIYKRPWFISQNAVSVQPVG